MSKESNENNEKNIGSHRSGICSYLIASEELIKPQRIQPVSYTLFAKHTPMFSIPQQSISTESKRTVVNEVTLSGNVYT